MANNSKYRNNRNDWARVYGSRRRKPSQITYLETGTSASITIDLNRTVRRRNYFQDNKPIVGTAVPPPPVPPSPFPDCVVDLAAQRWVADEDTITILGGGVDQWDKEDSNDPYKQTNAANRPTLVTDSSGSWVEFDGSEWMAVAADNTLDYFYDSAQGGSFVFIVRLPAGMTNGYLWSFKGNAFSKGLELDLLDATAGTKRWRFLYGVGGGSTNNVLTTFSPGFDASVDQLHVLVGTVNPDTDTLTLYKNGTKFTAGITPGAYSVVPSGNPNTIGSDLAGSNPLDVKIAVAAFYTEIFTDDEAACIATWAETNYGVVLD